jgi:hypothetical protein
MAGDWIKMRIDLQSHPKVVRILSAMRPHDVQTITDKFRVIGGLHAVWSVFDTHSIDGVLYGYTPETLDHIVGWGGFSGAMQQVEWLHFDGKETLTLPEFTEHNGQSAKRRAEDQKRKKNGRQSVRNLSAPDADKKRTREEKRRVVKNPLPPTGAGARFDRFWAAYPRKAGKDAARKAFAARKPDDALTDAMLAAVAEQSQSEQWKRDGGQYIPHPATWLNQGRWEDGAETHAGFDPLADMLARAIK